jgi:hypothetical protein
MMMQAGARVHGVTDGWWWWPVMPGIHFPFAVASQWERDTHWAPNTRRARRWMMQAGLFANLAIRFFLSLHLLA